MCSYVSLSHTSVSSAEEAGKSKTFYGATKRAGPGPPNSERKAWGCPTQWLPPDGGEARGLTHCMGKKTLKYGAGLQCFSLPDMACPPLSKPSHRRNWHRYLHTHVHRGVIHNKDGSNSGVHQWMKKSTKCGIDTSLFIQP